MVTRLCAEVRSKVLRANLSNVKFCKSQRLDALRFRHPWRVPVFTQLYRLYKRAKLPLLRLHGLLHASEIGRDVLVQQ